MVLFGGLSLLFFYDGLIGYPGQNHIADLHEVFVSTDSDARFDSGLDKEKRSEKRTRDMEDARKAANRGASWAEFSAAHMLAEEEPKKFSREEIHEQFIFGLLMALLVVGLGIFCFTLRSRAFHGEDEVVVFPGGRQVRFTEILEIDLQKWDRGIARLRYRESEGGERFAKIDDYKYPGTAAILKRAIKKNPDIRLVGDPRWLAISKVSQVSRWG